VIQKTSVALVLLLVLAGCAAQPVDEPTASASVPDVVTYEESEEEGRALLRERDREEQPIPINFVTSVDLTQITNDAVDYANDNNPFAIYFDSRSAELSSAEINRLTQWLMDNKTTLIVVRGTAGGTRNSELAGQRAMAAALFLVTKGREVVLLPYDPGQQGLRAQFWSIAKETELASQLDPLLFGG